MWRLLGLLGACSVLASGLVVMPAPASARFATLDRMEPASFKGYLHLDPTVFISGNGEGRSLRTDLYLQAGAAGLAGYVALPVASAFADGQSETRLGNVELGALAWWELDATDLVVRLGFAAPTSDPSFEDQLVLASGFWGRLTDIATVLDVDSWALRASFSPLWGSETVFLRADVGVDVVIPVAETVAVDLGGFRVGLRRDTAAMLRLNGGIGVRAAPVAFTLELVNVVWLTDAADRSWNGLTLAVHLDLAPVRAHVGAVVPLDADLVGEIAVFTTGAGAVF